MAFVWFEYALDRKRLDEHLDALAAGTVSEPSAAKLLTAFLEHAPDEDRLARQGLMCVDVVKRMGLELEDVERGVHVDFQLLLLKQLEAHDPQDGRRACDVHRWCLRRMVAGDSVRELLQSAMRRRAVPSRGPGKSPQPSPQPSPVLASLQDRMAAALKSARAAGDALQPHVLRTLVESFHFDESFALAALQAWASAHTGGAHAYTGRLLLDVGEVHFFRRRMDRAAATLDEAHALLSADGGGGGGLGPDERARLHGLRMAAHMAAGRALEFGGGAGDGVEWRGEMHRRRGEAAQVVDVLLAHHMHAPATAALPPFCAQLAALAGDAGARVRVCNTVFDVARGHVAPRLGADVLLALCRAGGEAVVALVGRACTCVEASELLRARCGELVRHMALGVTGEEAALWTALRPHVAALLGEAACAGVEARWGVPVGALTSFVPPLRGPAQRADVALHVALAVPPAQMMEWSIGPVCSGTAVGAMQESLLALRARRAASGAGAASGAAAAPAASTPPFSRTAALVALRTEVPLVAEQVEAVATAALSFDAARGDGPTRDEALLAVAQLLSRDHVDALVGTAAAALEASPEAARARPVLRVGRELGRMLSLLRGQTQHVTPGVARADALGEMLDGAFVVMRDAPDVAHELVRRVTQPAVLAPIVSLYAGVLQAVLQREGHSMRLLSTGSDMDEVVRTVVESWPQRTGTPLITSAERATVEAFLVEGASCMAGLEPNRGWALVRGDVHVLRGEHALAVAALVSGLASQSAFFAQYSDNERCERRLVDSLVAAEAYAPAMVLLQQWDMHAAFALVEQHDVHALDESYFGHLWSMPCVELLAHALHRSNSPGKLARVMALLDDPVLNGTYAREATQALIAARKMQFLRRLWCECGPARV